MKFYIVPTSKKEKGFVMSSILRKEKTQIQNLLKTNGILEAECEMGMFPNGTKQIGIIIRCDTANTSKVQSLIANMNISSKVWIGETNSVKSQ